MDLSLMPDGPQTALKSKPMTQFCPQIVMEAVLIGGVGATTRRWTRPVF